MRHVLLPAIAAAALVTSTAAHAVPGYIISGSVGGAPTGVTYENFNSLPLGTVTNAVTPSGVIVTTTPSAGVVQGSVGGQYAAPYLSGGNGTGFGPGGTDQSDGADTTPYITAGSTGANPNSAVTLLFPSLERYMGILWGSVDAYNTLSLYNGDSLVGTITGSDVTASPNGNQGVDGTIYVNIDALSTAYAFNKAVLTSSQFAFEADNLAFNPMPVPEPAGVAVLGLGLAAIGWVRARKPHRVPLAQ